MPTRRLVVALAVLLVGVFGVGIVTAVTRSGESPSTTAQPTQSPTPTFSEVPFTTPPVPTESPTPQETQTPVPTVSPTATTGGGGGGGPKMPNTGTSPFVAVYAVVAAGAAFGARRLAR